MPTQGYYTHNLSPYIFTVQDLNLSVLKGWPGIVLLVVFLALEVFFYSKKKTHAWAAIAELVTLTVGGLLVVFFALDHYGVNWGLRWYSTMYLLGFIQVYVLCRHWISKQKIMLTPYLLDSLIGYLIFGMVLGARSFYVLIYNFDAYVNNPLDALKVWEGGLSFHGGIVGVIVAITLFCRKYSIPFFHLADKLVLCVPLGIGLGRIGNFMNGELYGRVIRSDVPWAVIFPEGGPQPRHPSQIYQSIGEGWLLLLTLFLIYKRPHREGTLSIAFVFFYCAYRFPAEFFREADAQLQYYFNNTLTMGQILCLVFMLAMIGLYFINVSRNPILEGSEDWKRRISDFLARRKTVEAV